MHPEIPSRQAPRMGLIAAVRRLLLGDRVKRAHVSDHGTFMRTVGRAWAVPMTLVFSSGALITLGQKQISVLFAQYQHHEPLDYVTLALLAITFVIVGGMDLTLLNSAVELRDARLRGVNPSKDPYTRGAQMRVLLVSLVESATFMSVAYQLDQPPSFVQDPWACLVAWGFIVARALTAPVCAMYLATLGKRAMVRREMYGNLLLTIGGTIQQIIENLQFAADERLIEPLWRMQVLVDRASRAQSDDEMDRFDGELLRTLSELRHLRDRLSHGAALPRVPPAGPEHAVITKAADTSQAVIRDGASVSIPLATVPEVKWSRDTGERIQAWALGELDGADSIDNQALAAASGGA
jgi:hypothetical protein